MTGNMGETRAQRRDREAAAFAARYMQNKPAGPPVRTPLTGSQHILHLLLTVLTGGLWGIVWIIRAAQGNRTWPTAGGGASAGRQRRGGGYRSLPR